MPVIGGYGLYCFSIFSVLYGDWSFLPRTRGPLFREHTNSFFARVGFLDLKKDIHRRDNIITHQNGDHWAPPQFPGIDNSVSSREKGQAFGKFKSAICVPFSQTLLTLSLWELKCTCMERELYNSSPSTLGHERSITACMCAICTKVLRQYVWSDYMTEWPIWLVTPRHCNITCHNRLRILELEALSLLWLQEAVWEQVVAVIEAEENRLLHMNSWLLSPVGPSMNQTSDQPYCTTLGMDPLKALVLFSVLWSVSTPHYII